MTLNEFVEKQVDRVNQPGEADGILDLMMCSMESHGVSQETMLMVADYFCYLVDKKFPRKQ